MATVQLNPRAVTDLERVAGLATGLFESTEAIALGWRPERRFEAAISQDRRDALYAGWKHAVARARLRTLELQRVIFDYITSAG